MSATQSAEISPNAPTSNGSKRSHGKKASGAGKKKSAAANGAATAAKAPAAAASEIAKAPAGSRASATQVIQGLVGMLPPAGAQWSQQEAANWMTAIGANLRVIYNFGGSLSVTATPAAAA